MSNVRRYQVFVSSTLNDLIDERQAVVKAILDMRHFPCGMELFPAANIGMMESLKKMIDESDYYVLIVGGKYGSIHAETKKSYTEYEYDYAMSVPSVYKMRFIHANHNTLGLDKRETETSRIVSLNGFIERLKSESWLPYADSQDLQSRIKSSLHRAIAEHPGAGWISTRNHPLTIALNERAELLEKINHLEKKVKDLEGKKTYSVYDIDLLTSFRLDFMILVQDGKECTGYDMHQEVNVEWKAILVGILPLFLHGADNRSILPSLTAIVNDYNYHEKKEGVTYTNPRLGMQAADKVITSLSGNGYITQVNQKWFLTDKGKELVATVS